MATCKKCGAPIIWVRTLAGRPMPCDAGKIRYRKDPKGDLKIVTPRGAVVSAVADGESPTVGLQSHFATCPGADEFRKRTRGKDSPQ